MGAVAGSHATAPESGSRAPSHAKGALFRECFRLIIGNAAVPWPEAIDEIASTFGAIDLENLVPQSRHERTALRHHYNTLASAVLAQEGIADLRALETVLRGNLGAQQNRPWNFPRDSDGRLHPLPASSTACRREILARFADPRFPIRRVHVEGAHTQEIYGYDLVDAIDRAWCITAVPRPEILAVDFDGNLPWARVKTDLVQRMEKAGMIVAILPSGRAIENFIEGEPDVRLSALGVGIHVLCLVPSPEEKDRWAVIARSMGGDVRATSPLRVPFFAFKTQRVAVDGRAAEHGALRKDSTRKRLYKSGFLGIENLQSMTEFLRLNPLWSDVPLYSPVICHPADDDGWRGRRAAEESRGGHADKGQPVRLSNRERLARPSARQVRTMSSEILKVDGGRTMVSLAAELQERLDRGDVADQFPRPDGSGTDRSRMGFSLLWRFQNDGFSRQFVEGLVGRRAAGLAAYWERADGESLFDRDWRKIEGARRHGGRRAEVTATSILLIERKPYRDVALAMLALGRRPAPGVRRLCELTGYSIRTVWLALGWLEGRFLQKAGTQGPGSTHAQAWRFLAVRAAATSDGGEVNTKEITPPLDSYRVLQVVKEAIADHVPLRALSQQEYIDASAGVSWSVLSQRIRPAVGVHKEWVATARLRHTAQRAEYARRLRRASSRGVPFATPREAFQRRVASYGHRMRSAHDDAHFRDLSSLAEKAFKGDLPTELSAIPSPSERLREVQREWLADQRAEGGKVEEWLVQVVEGSSEVVRSPERQRYCDKARATPKPGRSRSEPGGPHLGR
jgi:hypothetical protein